MSFIKRKLKLAAKVLVFLLLLEGVFQPIAAAQMFPQVNNRRSNLSSSVEAGKSSAKSFNILSPGHESMSLPGANDMMSMNGMRTMGGASALSYTVHVLGEVARPGTYKVLPSDRVTDVINYAGSLLPNGSEKNIELRRQGSSRGVDIYRYKHSGDLNQNPYLTDNDVIFVPLKKGEIEIEGPVSRPGYYEIDGPLTMASALKLAGGVTKGYSARSPIRVIRFTGEGKKDIIEVHADDASIQRKFMIQKGDIVVAPHILLEGHEFDYNVAKIPGDNIFFPTINSNVNVIGAVTTPGAYPFQPSFDYMDYVGLAGPTHQSSLKRVKIITADGKKHSMSKVKMINPGDTLIVPTKSVTVANALTWFNTIASTTLTTILLYNNLSDQ